MFSKSFDEMLKVDISNYVKNRDGADYLPWADCKKLLHDNGAEVVMFEPIAGADGSNLRKSDTVFKDKNGVENRVYEVLVKITVDNIEWTTSYPVINGNNPVKDNSMNQIRGHNAIRRAFVKGVAERIGLGFNLWLNDEENEEGEDLSKHSLAKCMERFQELVTAKINQGIPLTVICDRLGMDEESFRAKFSLYRELARLEKAVGDMQP